MSRPAPRFEVRLVAWGEWRGQGVGGALLAAMLGAARERGFETVLLNAQVQALGFYRRHGFEVQGEVFLDAGIPHRAMRLDLKPAGRSGSRG